MVLDLRPHWWFIAPAAAALAAALVFGIFVLSATENQAARIFAGIIVLIAVGFFVVRYARWAGTNFVVTSDRVISRTGVVAKRGIEIPLDRINTVFFNQSIFERIIGAGDLGIESAGEGGRQEFTDIRKPNLVQNEIYRQVESLEDRRLRRLGQAAAEAAPATPAEPQRSIPEQIEMLDQLRRQGAVTDEEFEAKKRELLDRM